MERQIINLYEFQTALKSGIERIFPSRLWIRAEISAVKARPGGHCYMELSQSGDSGLVAKCQAVIWSSKYRFIAPYFESVTGEPLHEGMEVLVCGQVSYSQLYGLTVSIDDIDPEFSLGEKEKKRLMTIERLKQEGLMEMQRSLSLAVLPRCFAVISAADAAGYRDFMRHLHGNPYGFAFETEFYPAVMQGAEAPSSIVAALEAVHGSGREYDAVLVLRGGGSKLDLACYDDYELCANIAQFPLPVLTAVGHDQDYHICDMVAYDHLKTPTALADEMIARFQEEDARLLAYATRLKLAFSSKIALMESKVNMLEVRINAADPRNIVRRGYVLALDEAGVVMKGAKGRKKGDRVSFLFFDGTMKCIVDEVTASS